MSKIAKDVWVLADDRPGNVSQALGVAEALGLAFTIKTIRYNRLGDLPNVMLGSSLAGLSEDSASQLGPPWPEIVISAGRRTAPVARWIKKQADGAVFLAHIMDPGLVGSDDFDLIAIPDHDRPDLARANVFPIIGAPHRVTPQRLADEAAIWRARLPDLPRPWIGLIIGGSTRHSKFTPFMACEISRALTRMTKATGGAVLATTSRRTGQAVEDSFTATLPQPYFFYPWAKGEANPYFGLLALSDALVVTGDSVSMLCESLAAEKPVYLYAPPDLVPAKHQRLHRYLAREGYVKPLTGEWQGSSAQSLNVAARIACEIKDRLGL